MKRFAALVALGLAVAGCGNEPAEHRSERPNTAPPPPASKPTDPAAKAPKNGILAFSNGDGGVVRVDPVSLQPVSNRSVSLSDWSTHAASPDGSFLVFGLLETPALQFVDVRRMRALGELGLPRGEVAIPGGGSVSAIAWPERDRVVALVEARQARVVAVDPLARRVLAERRLDGVVVAARETDDGLVILLSPFDSVGPSMLAVASSSGSIRFARLDAIHSGFEGLGSANEPRGRELLPGLAVDPREERAVVVSPARQVAEVDLDTLAVSYHELSEPVSLLERLRSWLEPPAYAKAIEGPSRYALWLGKHHVAVTGVNYRIGEGDRVVETPAGLDLIDTRQWSVRKVDRRVFGISRAGPLLLAYAGSHANGLTAYGPDGGVRFRVLENRPVLYAEVAGRYAYAAAADDTDVFHVVDLRRGRVVGPTTNAGPVALIEGS
jgi:hypothetical protein